MPDGVVLIVGGTGGLGRELAARYRERGSEVIITGRDAERASAVAAEIGEGVTGLGFHLSHPETIAGALADVGPVSRLVLAAIARDNNPIHEYDIARRDRPRHDEARGLHRDRARAAGPAVG